MNRCAEISGGSIKRPKNYKFLSKISTLSVSSCLKHWACKSFSCEGLGQPPLAAFQKSTGYFRKTEGTSLHGECWLFALPLCLSVGDSGQWSLSGLLLSALGVKPALAGSVACREIHDIVWIDPENAGLHHRQWEKRKGQAAALFHGYVVLHFECVSSSLEAQTLIVSSRHSLLYLYFCSELLKDSHLTFHIASFDILSLQHLYYIIFKNNTLRDGKCKKK